MAKPTKPTAPPGKSPEPPRELGSETPPKPIAEPSTVFVVDDDRATRDGLRFLLEGEGLRVIDYASAAGFLTYFVRPATPACLILDLRLIDEPGDVTGLKIREQLAQMNVHLPTIMVSGYAKVENAVRAMRAGALHFLEKPYDDREMLAAVQEALEHDRQQRDQMGRRDRTQRALAQLSEREREVLAGVLAGHTNRKIAADLSISPRTVEHHRRSVMTKLAADSLAELVKIVHDAGKG